MTTLDQPGVHADLAPAPAVISTPLPGAKRHPHWRGLDGLRAIAVISVVAYHFSPARLTGGFLGVDVFFVISGYLITRLLIGEYLATGRIDPKAFYLRRVRRLLPALLTIVTAAVAASLIWRDQLATVRGGALATLGFVANWWLALAHHPYFVTSGRPSMFTHLWSLGVEEQFYLFWPLVCAATLAALTRANRRGKSPAVAVRRLALLAIAGAGASTALTWFIADANNAPYGPNSSLIYYYTETHCMGLLLGAALGALAVAGLPKPNDLRIGRRFQRAGLPRRLRVLRRVGELARFRNGALDLIGVASLGVLIWIFTDVDQYWLRLYRGGLLLVAAIVTLLIACATRPGSRLGLALDCRPLRWIGVRSYSIYLWHWPIAVVTRPGIDNTMPVALDQVLRVVLTLVLSALSYRFIERPVRRLGFRTAASELWVRVRLHTGTRLPRPELVASTGFLAVSVVALGVMVIGPSAPRSPIAQLHGGKRLSLGTGTADATTPPAGPKVSNGVQLRDGLPRISGFGDSVMLGARSALAAKFAGGYIDAIEARQPGPILADVRAAARAHRLAPLVVIHVGDNGVIDPTDFTKTMSLLSKVPLVEVFTDHIDNYTRPWQDPNNNLIDRVVPQFPNAVIVRWNSEAASHRGWLYSDDLHLRPFGGIAYADLIADAWFTAYPGDRPTRQAARHSVPRTARAARRAPTHRRYTSNH